MAKDNKPKVNEAVIKTGLAAKLAQGATKGATKGSSKGPSKTPVDRLRQAVSPVEPASTRYAKYGLTALATFAAQALLNPGAPAAQAPAGQLLGADRKRAPKVGADRKGAPRAKSNKPGIAETAIKTGIATKVAQGAGKAALNAGKTQAKLVQQAAKPGEPVSVRFAKYGLAALLGFALGALLSRLGGGGGNDGGGGDGTSASTTTTAQGGETWGSGTTTGASGSATAAGASAEASPASAPHQRPGDASSTGAERDYSDPSSGPLIGREHRPGVGGVPEQQEDVEQRIRSRVGEDPRTLGLSRLNVEVNDGIAEIRGTAPTQVAKDAVGEVAAGVVGVREVRNLLTLN